MIVFIADRNGVVEYANPRAEEWALNGRSPLEGRLLWDLFEGSGVELVRKQHYEALRSTGAIETQDKFERVGGGERTTLSIRFALRGDDGAPDSVCWEAIDVSLREEQRARLHRSEALSRAVLASMPASMAVLDADGTIREVNDRWLAFARENGAPDPNAWVGADYVGAWEKSAADQDVAEVARGIRDVLAGVRQTFSLEYPCHSPSEQRWFGMHVRALDSAGTGAVVFHHDISPSMLAKLALERLNATLEQRIDERTRDLRTAVEELEMFTRSVSHDLRSPLRTMSIYSDLLREEHGAALDETGRERLGRLSSAATRMAGYLDGLLKLSHLGRGSLDKRETNLSALAAEVITDLREHDPERDVEVSIEAELVVVGDPPLLRAVMENLLGNAWKYTSSRRRARIEVGARAGGCFVRDNGIGFDMAFKDRLFMPFQRLHESLAIAGDGLGLAAAKRIVDRHGGRLWAEGRPDMGATFYLELPPGAS